MQHINLKSLLCSVFCLCLAHNAIALESDYKQPINISSQEQIADLNSNLAKFIGNVIITQGSIEIKADNVTIKRNNKGKLDSVIANGNPVSFKQTLDDGKKISSRSSKLEYITAKNVIVISGKALIQQGESKLSGDRIEYNLNTRTMKANTSAVQGGRVSSTFIPSEVKNDK